MRTICRSNYYADTGRTQRRGERIVECGLEQHGQDVEHVEIIDGEPGPSWPWAPAMIGADDEPVHAWFELSYANYQVLSRTLMQSMPAEWQRRMVACLEELRGAFEHVEQAPGYEVRACRWQAPDLTDDDTLLRVGFSWEDYHDGRTYYDRDGNEVDAWRTCVPVPVTDPIPHYDRGRARVKPYERVDVPARQATDGVSTESGGAR